MTDIEKRSGSVSHGFSRAVLYEPICIEGWIHKWTNILGSWRPRYFFLEPDSLKYALGQEDPIKSTLMLRSCKIRGCPADPLRLEIESFDQGTFFLRFDCFIERQKWFGALKNNQKHLSMIENNNSNGEEKSLGLDENRSEKPNLVDDPFFETVVTSNIGDVRKNSISGSTNTLLSSLSGFFGNNIIGSFFPHQPSEIDSTSDNHEASGIFGSLLSPLTQTWSEAQSTVRKNDFYEHQTDLENFQSHDFTAEQTNETAQFSPHRTLIPPKPISRLLVPCEPSSRSGMVVNKNKPLVSLLENSIACAKHIHHASAQIRSLQASALFLIGFLNVPVKDSDNIKSYCTKITQQVDLIENIIEKHLKSCEKFLAEETVQRKQLRKSFAWLAKQSIELNETETSKFCPIMNDYDELSEFESSEMTDDEFQECFEDTDVSVFGEVSQQDSERDTDSKKSLTHGNSNITQEASKLLVDVSPVKITGKIVSREDFKKEDLITVSETHRTVLPVPRCLFKISLWSLLKDCLGKDLSRISFPVYFNEPTSFLQRIAEDFQYARIIRTCCSVPDSMIRMCYIAIYSITPYCSANGRTYKPFNPMLGETFDFDHKDFKILCEQVGHHPPVAAYHVENEDFDGWGHLLLKTKVTGKSLEISMPGPIHIKLPSTGDHFSYNRSKLLVHNILWGTLWIELDGNQIIRNHTTNEFAVLYFTKRKWFDNKSLQAVVGYAFDSTSVPRYYIGGFWAEELFFENVTCKDPDFFLQKAASVESTGFSFLQNIVEECEIRTTRLTQTRRVAWRPDARPENSDQYYGFSYITMQLNEFGPSSDPRFLPRTDSRFRPDQRAYENGDTDLAISEKQRLEEKQRITAKTRVAGEADYHPRWFERNLDIITRDPCWTYKGGYWEAKNTGIFQNCPDIF